MHLRVITTSRVIQSDDLCKDEITLHAKASVSKTGASVKVISKSARAKKLLNKKIKINQHIMFDEDGEPVEQDNSCGNIKYPDEDEKSSSSDSDDDEWRVHPTSIDEYEKSERRAEQGGIRIEKAKELLRSRDKVDRKRERERIRTAHREKKLKSRRGMKEDEKAERMATGGVRIAVVSSSEDDQEGQMSEFDHIQSSLPSEIERNSDSVYVSSSEEKQEPKRQKLNREKPRLDPRRDEPDNKSNERTPRLERKRQKLEKKQGSKKKTKQHEQLGMEPEPPSLVDDEDLALHLLTC